jgi:outer membrane protein
MIHVLLLALALSAGDTLNLTLDEAVDMAVERNLDYRVQALTHTQTKLGFAERVSTYLPQPMLQGTYSEYETQYAQGIPSSGYYVNLSVSQTIFDFGKLASIWSGKTDLDGSSAGLAEARNSLSYDVENLYLAVLKEEKALEISESALRRAEENRRLIGAKERLGQASRLDILNAGVTYNQSKLALINARKSLKVTERLFLNVLGITGTRELILESPPGSEAAGQVPPLDSLLEGAYKQRPTLQSLSKKVTSAKTDFTSQLLSLLPSLSYEWSWVYRDEEFPSPDRFQDESYSGRGLTAGVSFNPVSYVLGVQRSKTALDIVRAELSRTRLVVAKQVEEAYFAYMSAGDNLELARLTLEAAEEGRQLARTQYSLGLLKPLELFDSETRLQNAEADYLAAIYDLKLAMSALRFAVGGRF